MFWLIWLERNNRTFQNKTDMTEGIAIKARVNVTVRATHNDLNFAGIQLLICGNAGLNGMPYHSWMNVFFPR